MVFMDNVSIKCSYGLLEPLLVLQDSFSRHSWCVWHCYCA